MTEESERIYLRRDLMAGGRSATFLSREIDESGPSPLGALAKIALAASRSSGLPGGFAGADDPQPEPKKRAPRITEYDCHVRGIDDQQSIFFMDTLDNS
ncbi:MAG: hypothetical protein U0790_13905 [Isosphaeraceae bacterium]